MFLCTLFYLFIFKKPIYLADVKHEFVCLVLVHLFLFLFNYYFNSSVMFKEQPVCTLSEDYLHLSVLFLNKGLEMNTLVNS